MSANCELGEHENVHFRSGRHLWAVAITVIRARTAVT